MFIERKKLFIIIVLLIFLLCITVVACNKNDDNSSIYNSVNSSVVYLSFKTKYGDETAGSGFFIDDYGTVATNYHVIEGATSGKIYDSKGDDYKITKVLGYDKNLDIAIIKTDCNKSSAVKTTTDYSTGEHVYAIGYPKSFIIGRSSSTITDGIISNSNFVFDKHEYIQTTANITNGNSGGVLLNDSGEVIGITAGAIKIDGVDYINLAIPIKFLSKVNRDRNETLETVTADNIILPEDFTVDNANIVMNIGETEQIYLTVYPLKADASNFSFSSSNTNVATVTSSGLIQAKSSGTTYISIKTNGITKKILVTVNKKKLTIQLNTSNYKDYISIDGGETVTVSRKNGYNVNLTYIII